MRAKSEGLAKNKARSVRRHSTYKANTGLRQYIHNPWVLSTTQVWMEGCPGRRSLAVRDPTILTTASPLNDLARHYPDNPGGNDTHYTVFYDGQTSEIWNLRP